MDLLDLSELIFKKKGSSKKPALFFDRDGVLIKDCNYISNTDDVFLEKGSKDLVRFAYNQGWIIVIVSNQSGISRKLLTWQNYQDITNTMMKLFGEPNPFYAIYANSQGPDSKNKYYNKLVKHDPKKQIMFSHEKLYRIDDVYDLFIDLSYNKKPIVKGKGSAIFIHCSFSDFRKTNGCIALSKKNLKFLINNLQKLNYIYIS